LQLCGLVPLSSNQEFMWLQLQHEHLASWLLLIILHPALSFYLADT